MELSISLDISRTLEYLRAQDALIIHGNHYVSASSGVGQLLEDMFDHDVKGLCILCLLIFIFLAAFISHNLLIGFQVDIAACLPSKGIAVNGLYICDLICYLC